MVTESNKKLNTSTDQEEEVVLPRTLFEKLIETLEELSERISPIEQLRPLSLAEATKALRCRRKDVEKLIMEGHLPVINRGGRRYVLMENIRRRLKEETQIGNPAPNIHSRKYNKCTKPFMPEKIDPQLKEFFK